MTAVLLTNLAPLYILIALGYICGRWLDVNLHSMATVAIFILSPVVMFGAITQTEFHASYLLLPLLIFILCITISFSAYKLSYLHFHDKTANLIGMASGTGNTGYFGLPLVIALLGNDAAGLYLMMLFGLILYEITYGYYIGARGNYTVPESLHKVIRLPAVHAVWLALLCNYFGIKPPALFYTYAQHFTGAWIIIGMMLIGVGIAKVKPLRLNIPMVAWLFFFRFVVWPLAAAALVWIDKNVTHLYGDNIHLMMVMIGIVPLAANPVAFAEYLKLPAGEVAMAVLLSTVFAVIFMPLALSLLVG